MSESLEVGDRVRFTGFITATFDFPDVKLHEFGNVTKVRESEEQIMMDYMVQMDSGSEYGFDTGEIVKVKR